MVPKSPITLRLKNGEEITFSVEEINHPLFKIGWEKAEQGKGALGDKWLTKIGNLAYSAHLYREPIDTKRSAESIHALFGKKDVFRHAYPPPFVKVVEQAFPQNILLKQLLAMGAPAVGKILSGIRLERAITSQLVRTLIFENKIEELKEKADKAHEIEEIYEWWCRIYYHQE